MFRYFVVLLILFGIFNDVSAHNRKVASDGCHREGDSYSNEARYYEVDRVIDGDTLDFIYSDQGIITTRLYGVDTPEIRKGTKLTKDAKSVLEQGGTTPNHDDYNDLLEAEKNRQLELGAAATQYVKDTLTDKDVFVLFEDSDTFPFIQKDSVGRFLAYVFYADDTGTRMLNLQLIAEGHAEADYLDAPFRYRWAFIDDDIDAVRERIASVALPEKPIALSPASGHRLTTSWASLKKRYRY
ncbi:MAG: thermonuclease family protein [Candidatus Poribacteria bacterium]|nr:thermonuclease family protein [Candidatus Poribacteria bacterium]